MHAGDRVWTRQEARALQIARNRGGQLFVYEKTEPVPRRTSGIFKVR
jgi:hypothetical protein